MRVTRPVVVFAGFLLAGFASPILLALRANEEVANRAHEAPDQVVWKVRVQDAAGRPVENAEVGLCHGFSREEGWRYVANSAARTDADGQCTIKGTPRMFEVCSLSARDSERRLVAFANTPLEESACETTLTLAPARRVRGKMLSRELAALGDDPGRAAVSVYLDGRFATEHWGPDHTFELLLSPGTYRFDVQSFGGTEQLQRTIEVSADERDLELEFDLPVSRLRKLQGQPAPELAGAIAWKNSEPLTLAELRGKVVLLDFWGWWCGACIHRMPELFELHDRFRERGLVIIGIHVDAGNETPTVAALDQKLTQDRQEVWKGRDVPYPVAMFPDKAAPHPGRDEGSEARGHIAAEYGIRYYPSYVLIDREGRVVGLFANSPEDRQRLEAMLQP